jgi:hypothetical protein
VALTFGNLLTPPEDYRTGGRLVTLYDGQTLVVSAGTTQAPSDVTFLNLSGYPAVDRIGIHVYANGAVGGGAPVLSVLWYGAQEADQTLGLSHTFWSGLTLTATDQSFFYTSDIETNVAVIGGSGSASPYMFDFPYIGFAFKETGGVNDANVQVTAYFGLSRWL